MNTGNKLVKIDIIIETVMMNELTNILVDEGAPGYTIVGPVASRGGSSRMDKIISWAHGQWSCAGLNAKKCLGVWWIQKTNLQGPQVCLL